MKIDGFIDKITALKILKANNIEKKDVKKVKMFIKSEVVVSLKDETIKIIKL